MASSMTIATPMADISIFEGRTTCLIDLCSSGASNQPQPQVFGVWE